ncbi:MAG: hypothetical protein ABIN80_26350 [Dyadobacter sp.]
MTGLNLRPLAPIPEPAAMPAAIENYVKRELDLVASNMSYEQNV